MSLPITLLGPVDYAPTAAAMQAFTEQRGPDTADALWICEHPPVYTQGLAGKADHILNPGSIPIVQTNRGGQVTYHGPGQVVAYPLIDLQRAGYYVKEYVYRIEEAVIRTLVHFGVTGHRVVGAPGIYVRLEDPFSHAALTGPTPAGDPFRGLGKIAAGAGQQAFGFLRGVLVGTIIVAGAFALAVVPVGNRRDWGVSWVGVKGVVMCSG